MSWPDLCDFYPRPPRGGRHERYNFQIVRIGISIHALREEGDLIAEELPLQFFPISIHALREEGDALNNILCKMARISIHALREEGDLWRQTRARAFLLFLSTPSARRATVEATLDGLTQYDFYPRPPRGGRRILPTTTAPGITISIHALREEGDSKNGEKHLRFCFIIKRSAQIWKSLSKNIQKNSCDLHRTA